MLDDVDCACLELCDDTSITQSLYFTNWPRGSAADAIMLQYPKRSEALRHALVDKADMRLELLKIEVFFDELAYERISESPAYDVRHTLQQRKKHNILACINIYIEHFKAKNLQEVIHEC